MEPEKNQSETQREQEWELSDQELDRCCLSTQWLYCVQIAPGVTNNIWKELGSPSSGVVVVLLRRLSSRGRRE